MNQDKYQNDYSKKYTHRFSDSEKRWLKTEKIVAVLGDYYKTRLKKLNVLDIGCSTGFMTKYLSTTFRSIIGTDIDKGAIEFAQKNNSSTNTKFFVQNALDLDFSDNFFDVVICNHIYEHVPDGKKLMQEIYRVLKPGGVCYFAAGNRLRLVEQHYRLPLLSVLPKAVAHYYLKALKRGQYYYENHLTIWGLKKIVYSFTVIDYTRKILENPVQFHSSELLRQGSLKQKVSLMALTAAYWLCPTYIWLLKK